MVKLDEEACLGHFDAGMSLDLLLRANAPGAGMLRLDQLFYQGSYQEILTKTLETPGAKWSKTYTCYVVGALAFVGRVDDALVLLRKHHAELGGRHLAAARFYVGIGLVRVSRYDDGRRFIAENLRDWWRAALGDDPRARFYVYQGLAFFRYFQCRYARALDAAKKAWEASLEGDYAYGMTLASDLRGQAMIRTGLIASGLKLLDDSARLCERFGVQGQGNVVRAAQFYYRAWHGLFGGETLTELRRFVASFAPEDNFTLAVAHGELARQLAMRGRVREAEGYLEEAARVILKAGHRRHKVMVLHRFAHNRYYMGRFDDAEEYLAKAEAEADPDYDLDYLMHVAGLRLKIARRLGAATDALEKTVARLTQKTGSGVGRNIAWRDLGLGAPTLTGDDLYGDLRHKCRLGVQTPYADVLAILRAGMLGFLHEVVPEARQSRVVCFDLVPRRMAVFDEGDVTIDDEPVSATLKSVALQIARAPCTKRDLIESHWGFAYHPLRHDPLVYAVINRLRRALGSAAAWLQHDGSTYVWASGVRVFTYEPKGISAAALTKLAEEAAPAEREPLAEEAGVEVEAKASGLNHRQLAILTELGRRRFLNAQDCVEIFGVSRITAARDLGELRRKGLIARLGKGRATHYALKRT